MNLKDKNLLLCVTGSIAAYKACDVVRLLRKERANVQVLLTSSAQKFVGAATFAALTSHAVLTELFPGTPKAGLEHIELAKRGDAVIVLPATANIIGKTAAGIADDLVSTTLSVCELPTLFVPAMNTKMWQNPATMQAVEKLRANGIAVLEPDSGPLASLDEGEGRLPEIHAIMTAIRELFHIPQPLKGRRVLVTAGPTREPIDPVRYISNRSSGRMGYALAEAARDFGADVTLISGPTALPKLAEIKTIAIETAADMANAVTNLIDDFGPDLIFMTAAVADYTIAKPAKSKIKREKENLDLTLTPAIDILKGLRANTNATLIGFALETENGEAEALRKMTSKDTDFIVLNYANERGSGFDSMTNHVIIFAKDGRSREFTRDRKDRIARSIIDFVLSS